MPEVNLHDLINKPGAGEHILELIKSGHWDEYAGLPKKKWSVEVEAIIVENSTYIVDASCEDEAYNKVETLAGKDYNDYEFTSAKEL